MEQSGAENQCQKTTHAQAISFGGWQVTHLVDRERIPAAIPGKSSAANRLGVILHSPPHSEEISTYITKRNREMMNSRPTP